MTATTTDRRAPAPPVRRSPAIRALRALAWTLIVAGAVVLLYLVYSLFFTNLETDAAQNEMLEAWERLVVAREAEREEAAPVVPLETPDEETLVPPTPGTREAEAPPDIGSAVALIEFVRPGSDERPVRDDPLLVVEGVTREALTRGPGHYPDTALPGGDGNFAVAGHRTTYGSPFFHLDQVAEGDEIHVTDREGVTHVYAFVEQRVVGPNDAWVLGPDPLERGTGMLTLTTCHPRFSARQRLIVFAEFVR